MKKAVQLFIAMLGGTSSYSGHSTMTFVKYTRRARSRGVQKKVGWNYDPKRTLFINDPNKGQGGQSIEEAILYQFGFGLPFKLVTN